MKKTDYGTSWNPVENIRHRNYNTNYGTSYNPDEHKKCDTDNLSFKGTIISRKLNKASNVLTPFWIGFLDKQRPFYNVVVPKRIFRMKICGAYSRKYDRVRKYRKERLF